MHEQTPRTTMRDDPRLPPIEMGSVETRLVQHVASRKHDPRPVTPARAPEGHERLADALSEIRRMDTDLSEIRDQCRRQEVEIARQASYVQFLEGQLRTIDQERLLYMRKAVSLARQIKSIWEMCREGNMIALAAAELPGETEAERSSAAELAKRFAPEVTDG